MTHGYQKFLKNMFGHRILWQHNITNIYREHDYELICLQKKIQLIPLTIKCLRDDIELHMSVTNRLILNRRRSIFKDVFIKTYSS